MHIYIVYMYMYVCTYMLSMVKVEAVIFNIKMKC